MAQLTGMGINNRAKTSFATKTNDNNYSDLEYDDEGNIIHGVWSGHSWMWLEGGMESINSTAYPEYTMSDAVCPASDFSIILSYDHSELKW